MPTFQSVLTFAPIMYLAIVVGSVIPFHTRAIGTAISTSVFASYVPGILTPSICLTENHRGDDRGEVGNPTVDERPVGGTRLGQADVLADVDHEDSGEGHRGGRPVHYGVAAGGIEDRQQNRDRDPEPQRGQRDRRHITQERLADREVRATEDIDQRQHGQDPGRAMSAAEHRLVEAEAARNMTTVRSATCERSIPPHDAAGGRSTMKLIGSSAMQASLSRSGLQELFDRDEREAFIEQDRDQLRQRLGVETLLADVEQDNVARVGRGAATGHDPVDRITVQPKVSHDHITVTP